MCLFFSCDKVSDTNYIRVSTFEDQFIDVARAHFDNVAELKSYIEQFLGFPAHLLRILYAGRELQDHETLNWMDRVYACTHSAKKIKDVTTKKTCPPVQQTPWLTNNYNMPS